MSVYRRLVAKYYDRALAKVERLCLQEWRKELLADLHGVVLEMGAGTGLNLAWYPNDLERLVLCEPDRPMREQLIQRCSNSSAPVSEVVSAEAEHLPFPSGSFDFVVSTLVLCSVRDPQGGLAEIRRVLKPGGELVLMEHVAAEAGTSLSFWQNFWNPLWKRCACNCHLNRPTYGFLEQAGFYSQIRPARMSGAPAISAPMILGRACPAKLGG